MACSFRLVCLICFLLMRTHASSLDLATSLKDNAVKLTRLDSLDSSVYKSLSRFQLIMIGEMHGTNEPAKFVIGLTKLMTDNGDSVQVGLEIPENEMTKFLSERTDSSIYSSEFFTKPPIDGRENFTLAEVISILNKNKKVKLFFFVVPTNFSNPDHNMYLRIKSQINKNPHYKTITLSGNVHNRLQPYREKNTLGYYLKTDTALNISGKMCSLNHIYKSGTMVNNIGKGLVLREVNTGDTLYSTSVDSDNYLFLFPDPSVNSYNGIFFTKFVSAAQLVRGK
jgi:hypothetical protein